MIIRGIQGYEKIIICMALLAGLIMMPYEATSTKTDRNKTYFMGQLNSISRTFYFQTSTTEVLDALTVYNPTESQCDPDPLVTASNSKIDLTQLEDQQIRWMALSRDLLKRWKGKFHYGDTVLLTSGDAAIDGFWVIKDSMNKRFKKRGDLLFDTSVRTRGKWNHVEITLIKSKTLVL